MKSYTLSLLLTFICFTVAFGQINQSGEIIASYIQVKDALVNSNTKEAANASEQLGKLLEANKMDQQLVSAAAVITSSSDLKSQREAFKTVTDGLIIELKKNGTGMDLYVQYCPMAFNNTGANWLSLSEEVLNPYFGNMMLRCGKVTDKLN